ncbi:unnamed protein product, partial [Hymenolepis diminuta]
MASGNKTMLSARHRRSISKGSDNGLTKPEVGISPVETILVEKSHPPPYTIIDKIKTSTSFSCSCGNQTECEICAFYQYIDKVILSAKKIMGKRQ